MPSRIPVDRDGGDRRGRRVHRLHRRDGAHPGRAAISAGRSRGRPATGAAAAARGDGCEPDARPLSTRRASRAARSRWTRGRGARGGRQRRGPLGLERGRGRARRRRDGGREHGERGARPCRGERAGASSISRSSPSAAAAPLHACRLCEKLGIDRLIVPPGRGRGLGHRLPARALRYEATRGPLQRLDALRRWRGERAARARCGRRRRGSWRGGAGAPGDGGAADGVHALFGAGLEIAVPLRVARVHGGGRRRRSARRSRRPTRSFSGGRCERLAVEITNWSLWWPRRRRPCSRSPGGRMARRRRWRGCGGSSTPGDGARWRRGEVRREEFVAGMRVDGPR